MAIVTDFDDDFLISSKIKEPPKCSECCHFKKELRATDNGVGIYFEEEFTCRRNITVKTNVISGIIEEKNILCCNYERSNNFLIKVFHYVGELFGYQACKREGIFFKHRY